jgi:hypothetical protein
MLDIRIPHATELITRRAAPNKSDKEPTPVAPKTKPNPNTASTLHCCWICPTTVQDKFNLMP